MTSQEHHDKRWKRYENQLPGHRVQIDVKFIEPLKTASSRRKYYQFTAIDDCTRLRILRIYPRLNQTTAIQFLDDVALAAAVQARGHPDRQRDRVRLRVPLACPRQGHRPRLHQTRHTAAQRDG